MIRNQDLCVPRYSSDFCFGEVWSTAGQYAKCCEADNCTATAHGLTSNVPVQRAGCDNWTLALYPSRSAATGC
jgi:hypothetical protein